MIVTELGGPTAACTGDHNDSENSKAHGPYDEPFPGSFETPGSATKVRRVLPYGRAGLHRARAGTVEHVLDALVTAGIATDAELEQHLSNVVTGRLDLATSPMVSSWGRKPTT
jgi:hypothetical protein